LNDSPKKIGHLISRILVVSLQQLKNQFPSVGHHSSGGNQYAFMLPAQWKMHIISILRGHYRKHQRHLQGRGNPLSTDSRSGKVARGNPTYSASQHT